MSSATTSEIAWAAGLYEGEGNAYYAPKTYNLRLSLSSTDLDVVERFQRVVGGVGKVHLEARARANRKDIYRWRVNRWADAQAVAAMLFPFLCSRRQDQVLTALAAKRARLRPVKKHGTRSMYALAHCRCEPCIKAERAYNVRYKAAQRRKRKQT